MKFLILIIAVCYVHSSPVLVDKAIASDVNKVETTSKIESTQPIESAPSSVSIQKVEPVALVNEEDKKLVRTARDNKIEYVYVNADGQILPNQKDYVDRSALISHSLDELSTNRQDKVASSTKEPTNVNNKDPSASVNSKDWVSSSSDSKESTSEKASDALHYSSSGGFKVRSENVKSRLSNALPSTATVSNPSGLAQNSPTISALYPSQLNQAYSSNDVLNLQNPSIPSFSSYTPSLSYPLLLQSVYNPYMVNGASLLPSLSSSNYLTSSPSSLVARTTANLSPILSPEEVEVRRVLLAQVSPNINYLSGRLVSPLSTNNYLYGRTLSSLIIPQHQYTSQVVNSNPIVQQSTPFSDYLLPQQQSPNLISRTSLSNNNLGFGGLTSLDYGTNGLNVASSGLLLPQSLPLTQSLPMSQSYSTVLPQSIAYIPLIVPQHQYTPQVVNSNPIVQQSSQPSVVVQPPITTTADYTPRRTVITTTETTTNNAQPFTDSITATSNSGPLILPGITENETIEKPLFYASQNAALRLSSPYDSTLYSGIYPNRLIDSNFNSLPITTAYLPRYQTSNYYSRLAYPYSSTGYSYSRPLIAPYPSIYHSGQLYGPYNGVGYVSPMHYSADTSSILSKKAEETTKPVVKDQVVDKSNNLMYTIKTSKSESKETVSRLNDANKVRDDDKKAA